MKKQYHFQIAVKDVKLNGKSGVIIEGFASTPDIDRCKDIVEPEAFRGALEMYMKNPVVLRSHNADKPVGTVTMATITDQGLKVVAEIKDEQTAQEIEDGRMKAMSIGYVPLVTELQHKDGTPFNFEEDSIFDPDIVMVIKSLDLVEISIVSTPANGHALFTLQKSLKLALNDVVCKSLNINMDKKDIELKEVDEVIEDEAVKDEEVKEEETVVKEDEAVEDVIEKSDDAVEASEASEEVENSDESSEAETVENETEVEAEEVVEEAETDTEHEAEDEEAKSEDEAKGVLLLSKKDAMAMTNLKKVGVIEVAEKDVVELSDDVKSVIETADKAISIALKKIEELEAKLDEKPEKQALVMHEQLQATKTAEVSSGFKSLFTN